MKKFLKHIAPLLMAALLLFGCTAEQPTTSSSPDQTSPDTSYLEDTTNPSGSNPVAKPSQEDTGAERAEDPILQPPTQPSVKLPENPQPEDDITHSPSHETPSAKDESKPADSTFSIHFLDVGQADAALVECDGHYMLIDGGNKADSSLLYSVLKQGGIQHLDLIVATHAHEDHIGGIPGALNYAKADMTLCPVTSYDSDAFHDFVKYVTKNGGGITVPAVGDEYKLGSALVKILGVNGGEDVNDTSIVLKILYGETSFLFTGDAERPAEQTILASGADLSATVLKVGHHGSDTSTTYPFLREIMPAYAVISVGEGNTYGHPTEDTLSRLRDADVTVYRTDLQGDIYCTSDGNTVSFHVERNADADTLAPPAAVIPAPAPEPQPRPESGKEEAVSTDYILNKNTKKFHYPTCKSVKQMSEKNKGYYTGTRDELLTKGYDPCGNCHP